MRMPSASPWVCKSRRASPDIASASSPTPRPPAPERPPGAGARSVHSPLLQHLRSAASASASARCAGARLLVKDPRSGPTRRRPASGRGHGLPAGPADGGRGPGPRRR
jgi:hypothetical protein